MTTLTDTQIVNASGGLVELGYSQITSNVTISSSTAGSGTAVISPLTVVCDGGPVIVEFFSPAVRPTVGSGNSLIISLYQDGAEAARTWSFVKQSDANANNVPVHLSYRVTPSAGSHTFDVRAYNSTGSTGLIEAGSGSTAAAPAFLRVSKIVQATQWPAVTTGTIICTSSTRPSAPFEGQTIYETDTDRELRWSGSAWVSPDAAFRPPICIVERTGFSVADGANAAVAFNSSASVDTEAPSNPMHSTSTNNTRITARTSGVYLISANYHPTGGALANVAMTMELKKNGTTFEVSAGFGNAYINPALSASAPVPLNTGDYVELWYYNDNTTGTALTATFRLRAAWIGQS